jgi:hypothetical protein
MEVSISSTHDEKCLVTNFRGNNHSECLTQCSQLATSFRPTHTRDSGVRSSELFVSRLVSQESPLKLLRRNGLLGIW